MIVRGLQDVLTKPMVEAYFKPIPTSLYPVIYPTFFPAVAKSSIEFEITKNQGPKVTMANVQPFNKTSHKMGRDGTSTYIERMSPIKEGIVLDEKLYREFKTNTASPNAIKGLFDDFVNSYFSVVTRIEMMAMNALSTGIITINDNGFKRDVDMLVPDANKVEITDPAATWDNADADIIGDIKDMIVILQYQPGLRMLTSQKIINYMLTNDNIRKMIYGPINSTFMPVQLNQLDTLFTSLGLPIVRAHEARAWRVDPTTGLKTQVRYWPENIISFIPPGIGELAVAQTAEELSGAYVTTVRNGIALSQWEEVDPYAITTMAAAIQMPYLTNQDYLGILKPIA